MNRPSSHNVKAPPLRSSKRERILRGPVSWIFLALLTLTQSALTASQTIELRVPDGAALVSTDLPALQTRDFYSGSLNRYYQPSSISSLSMRGHDSTPFGGVVNRVTGCFYNESSFQRSLTARLSVVQGGSTIESKDLVANDLPSRRFSCRSLGGFSAEVDPGPYEIVVWYDRGAGDNFWFGLGTTTSGAAFDIQVGSQRPPLSSSGLPMRGAGISYRIDVYEDPQEPPEPPPPPPPAPLCTPTDISLCLGENGRFRVTATFDDGTRQDSAMTRAFDDLDDSGLFWFYSAGNLEMLVKILDGCPINQRFWVYFAATTDVGFELTVEDLEAGTSKVYTNELGNRANAITDTDAFETCSF